MGSVGGGTVGTGAGTVGAGPGAGSEVEVSCSAASNCADAGAASSASDRAARRNDDATTRFMIRFDFDMCVETSLLQLPFVLWPALHKNDEGRRFCEQMSRRCNVCGSNLNAALKSYRQQSELNY